MDLIIETIKLFGFRLDSEEIINLLATQPPYRIDKPNDGSQYVISKDGGFDLLFEDKSAIAGRQQDRTLAAIFLFSSGADKHKEYAGKLPLGFTFRDNRTDLLAKRQPNRTWLLGKGRVSSNHPNPSSDTWQTDQFNISADYWGDGRIHSFQINPPAPMFEETEWKAPPTWQDLALIPGQKLAAIQLYRKETGTNTFEAKQFIDDYLSKCAKST